ncbi:hypothetical protein SLOPH_968 [Spraguea lophii 42_110]|uniref:Uncharacterized protein n=1 Tax=Spraguea lophii (strain 42_110) TaxID=1358809 RepID=S7WAT2_SPRLO|nr:hypothetical protein SLOPH_968 [Spraguea lophii 42_110]
MNKNIKILSILVIALITVITILGICHKCFKPEFIDPITDFGYKLCPLYNTKGVCYFNTGMQFLYSGFIGQFFIENNFNLGSIENELKRILMKMRDSNGKCIDLQDDYEQLFNVMKEDPRKVERGGDMTYLLEYIFSKIHTSRLESGDFNDKFDVYFRGIFDFYYYKEKIKEEGEFRKNVGFAGINPYLSLREINVKRILLEYHNKYKGVLPKIIPFSVHGNSRTSVQDFEQHVPFIVGIPGSTYILRSIGVRCGIENGRPHIFALVRAGKFWFKLNDSNPIKRIALKAVFKEIRSIAVLYYEMI